MKHSLILLATAALLGGSAFTARAQQAVTASPADSLFEGSIHLVAAIPQLDDDKHSMTINIKGDSAEMEIDMGMQGKMRYVPDLASKKDYIVLDDKKLVMEMDHPMTSSSAPTSTRISQPNAVTIAGHPTTEYKVNVGPDGELSLWMASDFPKKLVRGVANALAGYNNANDAQAAALKAFAADGLVPVKIELRSGGELQASLVMQDVKAGTVDPKVFVVPATYQVERMPSDGGN